MILKVRSESDELLCTRYLNTRMELTGEEKFNYLLRRAMKGSWHLTDIRKVFKKKGTS